LLAPSSGDRCLAELAPAVVYIEFGNIIPPSSYQNLMAVVAIGIVSIMTRDIPDIDVMYPLLKGHIP